MLNKFSRVMKGRKVFIDLLNELASINKLNEFFILIKKDNNNCRIKGIYDMNLNKLTYPKNFRKSIYDIEYWDDIKYYKDETKAGYMIYRYNNEVNNLKLFNTIFNHKDLKRKLLGIYDFSLPWYYYY